MDRSRIKRLGAACGVLTLLASTALGGCAAPKEETPEVTTTTAAPPETTITTFATMNATLDATDVIVRDGPGMDYGAIGGMARGEAFTIVGREGDWYRIAFGDTYGYISAAYADVEGQPNASQMLADFTTLSRPATTSRTNPQPLTTTSRKGKKTTTTGTAAETTKTTAK